MATLEEMDGKLDMIITSIATIKQRCVDRGKTIDGHRKTLYGNDGTGGVVAKQSQVVQRLDCMNKVETTKKEWAMRIMGPIISGLIVAALLGLLVMWKFSGN